MGSVGTSISRRAPSGPLLKCSAPPGVEPTYSHHSDTVAPFGLQRKVSLGPVSVAPGVGAVIVGEGGAMLAAVYGVSMKSHAPSDRYHRRTWTRLPSVGRPEIVCSRIRAERAGVEVLGATGGRADVEPPLAHRCAVGRPPKCLGGGAQDREWRRRED